MRKCPFCAEEIQDEARICRFCQRDIAPAVTGAPSALTLEQRRAALQNAVPAALARLGTNWQVETQTDTTITFRQLRQRPNHVLHLILSLLTLGLWLVIWFFAAIGSHKLEKRQTLAIDEHGRVSWL